MERQKEGLSISRAVELWRSLEDEGRDPLQDMGLPPAITPAHHPSRPQGPILDDYRETWVQACLDFNGSIAEQTLNQAFALFPTESVCFEILEMGLSEIGSRWYQGEVTVQQEHFASAIANKRLNAILTSMPNPTRSGRIIIGCPPGEEHTFAPLLVTVLLRLRGWEVIYLGANVPQERFLSTLQEINPILIILAAQTLPTAASLLEIVEIIQPTQSVVAYGGSVFNRTEDIRNKIPAHFLGEDLKASIPAIEKLLSIRPKRPKGEAIQSDFQQAYRHYQQKLGAIESRLLERLQKLDLTYEHLSIALEHLSKDILASLKLGNMDFIDNEIHWIKTLVANHNLPKSSIQNYLAVYQEVAREVLDERGEPILEWFDKANLT
jgi:methanogenic corrinoid protein MtbC1